METRIAVVGVVIEDLSSVERLNCLLHDYGEYIVGRMGLPYRQKGVHIISLAVDAPQSVISAMTGKIGRLAGVNVKTAYAGGGA